MTYLLIISLVFLVICFQILYLFLSRRSSHLVYLREAKTIHRLSTKAEYEEKRQRSIASKKKPKTKGNFFDQINN